MPAKPFDAETIHVPLNRLDLAEANARRTGREEGLDELAASIAAHGLLHNLGVVRRHDAEGEPTGRYDVIAGGRRLAALRLLSERRKIAKGAPIPCRVLETDGDATGASLAENVVRVAMHPADQFEAFARLHAEGQDVERIARRFGVSPLTVRQRLRLASVSPALIAAFRAGEMGLEAVTAFAVTDDHEAQERVWRQAQGYGMHPASIRRLLVEGRVPLDDRRVRFVGLDAYEAAGGGVERDLFSEDGEGWIADPALLARLVDERLAREAEAVRAEGWGWVDALPALPRDLWRMARLRPQRAPLSAEDEARLSALGERFDAIEAECGDEPDEDQSAELDRIEAEIEAIRGREVAWRPEDRARSGAIVAPDGGGGVRVERGLLRPGEATNDGAVPEEEEADEAPRPTAKERPPAGLPAALRGELLAHRSAALQAEVAARPDLALRVLLHALIVERDTPWRAVAKVTLRPPALHVACPGIEAAPAHADLEARSAMALDAARVPEGERLWPWLLALDTAAALDLLAVLVAPSIDAGSEDWTVPGGAPSPAEQVAASAGLDMRRWWRPTAEAFFGRVTKDAIEAAVREGAGDNAARQIAGAKKAAMAEAAEGLLAGAGWLPEPLRARPTAEAVEPEAPVLQAAE